MRAVKCTLFSVLCMLTACDAEKRENGLTDDLNPADKAWSFVTEAPTLRTASCPPNIVIEPSENLDFTSENIDLFNVSSAPTPLPGLTFVGGIVLTSRDARFGGLSGLDIIPDGLIATSDAGAFFSFEMDHAAGFTPPRSISTWAMRDTEGSVLAGKREGDAEGVAFRAGLALVSFERNHRILAFDLTTCGAAARGQTVAEIPDKAIGLNAKIPKNRGTEAVTLNADGHLYIGLETLQSGNPIAVLTETGSASFRLLGGETSLPLTGFAALENRLYSLHRTYNPVSGNRIHLMVHEMMEDGEKVTRLLAELARPMAVDNFEGIAAYRLNLETVRLYIISDDNFSEKQRTLLMAFDHKTTQIPE